MVRHTRVSGDLGIKNLSVATDDIKAAAITTSKIGSALTQAGTIHTGTHWVYPVTYGAVPKVVVAPNGRQGSYPVFVSSIKAGSCVPQGSPGGVLQIIALGNR